MATLSPPNRMRHYPWVIVGLLWFCGFFNYADRQAVNAVFPLLKEEFKLSEVQLGWVASSFMVVYAISGPLAGFVVDQVSRRKLVALGLGFWSLIAAGTGLSQSYYQLLFFRAAEGLGESFYFPASMSLLSDYHGPKTRSRAMSFHQTSVYAGIIGGSLIAGLLARNWGWRMPFYVLGGVGCLYSLALLRLIVEPTRGKIDGSSITPIDPDFSEPIRPGLGMVVGQIVRSPAALILFGVFACANFVTQALVTWLPTFIHEKFAFGLVKDNATATLYMQGGSLVGVLLGGFLADRAAARFKGGRMLVQALGLLIGAPCVYIAGVAESEMILIAGLCGIGLGKGIYEANIFASLFDAIPAEIRGTAAGLMNTVGWSASSLAPVAIGYAAQSYGMSAAIASIAGVYLMGSILAAVAATQARPASKTALEV